MELLNFNRPKRQQMNDHVIENELFCDLRYNYDLSNLCEFDYSDADKDFRASSETTAASGPRRLTC